MSNPIDSAVWGKSKSCPFNLKESKSPLYIFTTSGSSCHIAHWQKTSIRSPECSHMLQIIFISGLSLDLDCFFVYTGSVSLVHGFTHDKSVRNLFSTPQARSQQQIGILILLLKKLAPVNDTSGVLYLVDLKWIFSPRMWKELQF